MTKGKRDVGPPMVFDGVIYWYTDWFDPTEDLCCMCRRPMPEEEVPFILFFKNNAGRTLQTRICETCTPGLFERGYLKAKGSNG